MELSYRTESSDPGAHIVDGIVVKNQNGYFHVISSENGRTYICRGRGRLKRDTSILVGDAVILMPINEEEARIESVLPRKTQLARPPVANIDQLVIVAACHAPEPSPYMLDKMIALAEYACIVPVLCVSKCDLSDAESEKLFAVYRGLGYEYFEACAFTGNGVQELKHALSGHITAFSGLSGVGKSSLLNAVLGSQQLATQEVSRRIRRGRNTTRHVELLPLDRKSYVMDTPGYSSLDMADIPESEVANLFRDFRPYLGTCRFNGCIHKEEPDCCVKKAVQEGKIASSRYHSYLQMLQEIEEITSRRY